MPSGQFALIGAENVGAMVGRLQAAGKTPETHIRRAMAEIAQRCYQACIDQARGTVYMDSIGDNYVFTGTLLRSHYMSPVGRGNVLGALAMEPIEGSNAVTEGGANGFLQSPSDFGRTSPGAVIAYIIGNNANQGEGGYAPFVHDGTYAMHPRPWMQIAMEREYEPATQLLDQRIVDMWNGLL